MFRTIMLSVQVAAQVPVAPPTMPAPDIIVTGERPATKDEVRRKVERVLPPLSFDQPLARFTVPVCPGVVGLARPSAQAIVDRIGVIADEVGLRVGEPGCDPNLLVLVVPDSRATVRRLASRRQGVVAAQSLADVRRIVAEPGAARAWVEAEVRSRDGTPLYLGAGGPPELAIESPSRVALSFRRDIVAAYIVIDAASVAGRDTTQIADYAAMRGLADGRTGWAAAGDSILATFTPDGDMRAPATLTAIDRGVLRGLYSGQGNRASVNTSSSIVATIVGGGGK